MMMHLTKTTSFVPPSGLSENFLEYAVTSSTILVSDSTFVLFNNLKSHIQKIKQISPIKVSSATLLNALNSLKNWCLKWAQKCHFMSKIEVLLLQKCLWLHIKKFIHSFYPKNLLKRKIFLFLVLFSWFLNSSLGIEERNFP